MNLATSTKEILSLIVVGTLWGITNPFIRKGSNHGIKSCKNSSNNTKFEERNARSDEDNDEFSSSKTQIYNFLAKIGNISIWLPYLVNQVGSVLFYKLLSNPNLGLSLAVPICNAIALIVSFTATTYFGHFMGIQERMDQPIRATIGITLILCGLALCMYEHDQNQIIDESNFKNSHTSMATNDIILDGVDEL